MAFNMLARGVGGGDGEGGGGFYDIDGGARATLLPALLAAARDLEDKEQGGSSSMFDDDDEDDDEDDGGLFRPLALAYGAEDGDDDEDHPLVCPEEGCGQRFQHRSAVKRHMRRHSGDLPYICLHPGCTKAFRESGALTMHTRVHTGTRAAALCPCALPREQPTHTPVPPSSRAPAGERPFVCQQEGCGKAFKASGALSRHLRVHSDERRFGCKCALLCFCRARRFPMMSRTHRN
jgi:uncharacterized Zn-finger protein